MDVAREWKIIIVRGCEGTHRSQRVYRFAPSDILAYKSLFDSENPRHVTRYLLDRELSQLCRIAEIYLYLYRLRLSSRSLEPNLAASTDEARKQAVRENDKRHTMLLVAVSICMFNHQIISANCARTTL